MATQTANRPSSAVKSAPATQADQIVSTELILSTEPVSVGTFCKDNGFNRFGPVIKINKNGYPFITFLDTTTTVLNAEGKEVARAENVYLSKKSSEEVDEGTVVNKELLNTMQVRLTTSDSGEFKGQKIAKIFFKGEGGYESTEGLD